MTGRRLASRRHANSKASTARAICRAGPKRLFANGREGLRRRAFAKGAFEHFDGRCQGRIDPGRQALHGCFMCFITEVSENPQNRRRDPRTLGCNVCPAFSFAAQARWLILAPRGPRCDATGLVARRTRSPCRARSAGRSRRLCHRPGRASGPRRAHGCRESPLGSATARYADKTALIVADRAFSFRELVACRVLWRRPL
jgi:hypothetical protein